jgi:hypothetical protein
MDDLQLQFLIRCGQQRRAALCRLRLFAAADVVKAVDGACDFPLLVLLRPNVHDHRHLRAVGPHDDDLRITHRRHVAAQHLGDGRLSMKHGAAVRPEQLERAAKLLGVISRHRLAPPQFRRTAVVFLNHPGGITAIDGHRPQLKQGTVTCFTGTQGFPGQGDDLLHLRRCAVQHGQFAQPRDDDGRVFSG